MEGTEPLIEDNDCYQNTMAGIGVRDGASPLILRNRCYENTLAGIGSRDGAKAQVYGNKCYRNKEVGIGTQASAKAFIAHNECYANEQAGIGQRDDTESTIGGNFIHHNKKAGIGFESCNAGKSLVIHNRIVDNELVAIGIHSGWKVRIADNSLSRDGGLPPIVMVFKGSEAEFTENTIKGSGVAGIRVEGTIRVVNNTFECPNLRKAGGPPQFAVWGLPGSRIEFLDNTVKGWRHGLHADKAAVIASGNQISAYWQAGIRVNDPSSPVVAVGNVFWSKDGHLGIVAPQGQGIVEDNQVVRSAAPK